MHLWNQHHAILDFISIGLTFMRYSYLLGQKVEIKHNVVKIYLNMHIYAENVSYMFLRNYGYHQEEYMTS